MDKFTKDKLIQKLEYAQMILEEVYDYACQNGLNEVKNQMSAADCCIIDALEEIEVK